MEKLVEKYKNVSNEKLDTMIEDAKNRAEKFEGQSISSTYRKEARDLLSVKLKRQ